MKNRKGFTLVEILAVIILLIIITLISIFAINKYTERSKLNAFIKEANTFAKAAESKFLNDKNLDTSLRSDLYNGTKPGRVCYSIYDDLLDTYVVKDKKYKYTGSIELCYGSDCTYQYKLWLTDGRKDYINGKTKFDTINAVEFSSDVEYFDSCEHETIGSHIGSPVYAEFDYLGTEQRMTILKEGNYRLEVWGAQGGDYAARTGGLGAYAVVDAYLKKGEKLYINVGGKGQSDCTDNCKGGYNDGGSAAVNWSSGGGATSIAKQSGTIGTIKKLTDLYVLAAGGGGVSKSSEQEQKNGVGVCTAWYCRYYSIGGAKNNSSCGGGYSGCDANYAGGGGVSYIGNSKTINGAVYCYKCSQDSTTKSINDKSLVAKSKTPKIGNGFARITYISEFKLAYDLSGGILALANPLNYNNDSPTITLNNPTKNGYDFTGWTDNTLNLLNLSTTHKTNAYILDDGTETDHNDYTIYETPVTPNSRYVFIQSSTPTNPGYAIYNSQGQLLSGEKYSSRSSITLLTPSNAAYIRYSLCTNKKSSCYDIHNFKLYKINQPTTVPTGSFGDRKFKAYYTPKNYTISYNLNGGSLAEGVSNPTSFNIESSAITLKNPSKSGYRYMGWTGSNGETIQRNVTIPAGSTGDKSYTANYSKLINMIFDYNIDEYTFASDGTFMSTGYAHDYDTDLSINMKVNVPSGSRRYLLIGNFGVDRNLNIEVIDNMFRVHQAGDVSFTSTIPYNEDVDISLNYTASNKSCTFTYNSASNSETRTGTFPSVDYSGGPLRLGQDHRGGATFAGYTLKGLVIQQKTPASRFPSNPTLPGYTFNGWYTSKTGGNLVTADNIASYENQTLYARWTAN